MTRLLSNACNALILAEARRRREAGVLSATATMALHEGIRQLMETAAQPGDDSFPFEA